MIDDYQYQSLNLPPTNGGLFGYGGQPSEGARGFAANFIDTSVNGGGNGSAGPQGPQGPQGPPGPGITLPSGSGVLGISGGSLFVYQTVDCEDA